MVTTLNGKTYKCKHKTGHFKENGFLEVTASRFTFLGIKQFNFLFILLKYKSLQTRRTLLNVIFFSKLELCFFLCKFNFGSCLACLSCTLAVGLNVIMLMPIILILLMPRLGLVPLPLVLVLARLLLMLFPAPVAPVYIAAPQCLCLWP